MIVRNVPARQCVLALHVTFPRFDAFLVVATKIKNRPYLEYQNTRNMLLFKKEATEKEMGVLLYLEGILETSSTNGVSRSWLRGYELVRN